MNCWILYDTPSYTRNSAFALLLRDACRSHGVDAHIVLTSSLAYGVRGGKPFVSSREGLMLPELVIRRCVCDTLSSVLEALGVLVYNPLALSRLCNSKCASHMLFSQLNIPSLPTAFLSSPDAECFEHSEFPAVVKASSGHGGTQVFLVRNKEEYITALEHIAPDEVLVQPPASESGRDVRVYALGGQILGAMLRSSDSDFRSNFCLGGSASVYSLSETEKEYVNRVLDAVGDCFIGIDFIFDSGKAVINELEDVVGCRMLYSLGVCDPAEALVRHTLSLF